MKKKVFIRVDGSQLIGLGHLVRCIALAQMLKDEFDVQFFSREIPDKIIADIRKCGFLFTKIDDEHSFFSTLTGKEIVVLDNYFFDSGYQKHIKELGCKLVCIDDLHDKHFYADLIINQVPDSKVSGYKAQYYTQFALGTDYVLLRSPFLKAATNKKRTSNNENLFICFGGADNLNYSTKTLSIVLSDSRFKKIIVVTGIAFHFLDKLLPVVNSDNRVQHFHDVDESKMLALLMKSDIAIVPASGILLEVLAAGCTVISGMYVNNQQFVLDAYKSAGMIESAQDFSSSYLTAAIDRIFKSRHISKKSIDGKSGNRILKCFRLLGMEDEVKLRRAEVADIQKSFEWATNPIIRNFSFSKHMIKYEDHVNWFLNKIKSDSCCYLIAEVNGEAIGSIRFDINGIEGVLSYLLDPNFHNRGLGTILLKKGVTFFKAVKGESVEAVVGFVIPENTASIKAFERLGYFKDLDGGNFKFTKPLK
jgi:UDP-2,4-diacetamido-2,4,6-trideoxy-beta-L-altropyranose hydrolase